jgi:hypothetical protein
VGPNGRIRITRGDFTLRLRFVTPTRAEAALRIHSTCTGNRHYVVRHTRPRIPVRTGRWVALVQGATATLEFEVRSFGRTADAQYLTGSVPATCSDGSARSLPLMESFFLIIAPIRPGGRFNASGAGGNESVEVSGTFDHGSVAALLDVSESFPDGTTCRARGLYVLGAPAFPY